MIVDGKIFPYKKVIEKMFEIAGQVLNENFKEVNLSINFVCEEKIKQLNKEFRNVDRVTDVLSFPNLNKNVDQTLKEFEQEKDEEGILFLGDIVICKKVAYKQAKEYGHSKKREICFLALHGLLHLLGYDHIEKKDEKLMTKTANSILEKFGVERWNVDMLLF